MEARQNQDIFVNETGVQSSPNENEVKDLHEVIKEVEEKEIIHIVCCPKYKMW
jgi:hypothetical protein